MAPLISKTLIPEFMMTFMVITLWHLLTVHFFLCILHISEAESVSVAYIYIPCRHSVWREENTQNVLSSMCN